MSTWAKQKGFTIVELLIVIVVIGILAALVVSTFSGARERAVVASIQSDLSNATKQIKAFHAVTGYYPKRNSCPSPAAGEICLKASGDTRLNYAPYDGAEPKSFSLSAYNGETAYYTSNSTAIGPGINQRVGVTNLVSNGNFSDGMNDWSKYCSAPTSCSFDSGRALIVADPAGTNAAFNQQIYDDYRDGDHIYYAVSIKKLGGTEFEASAHRNTGGYAKSIISRAQFNAQSVNSTVRYSTLRNFVESQGDRTSILIGRYGSGLDYVLEVDNVVVINLTKSFGVGNEPTATEMDAMLAGYPDGWFGNAATVVR